jgi:hypothetical protein
MPSLEIQVIEKIIANNPTFKTFVETGTYLGETILKVEPLFDNLYTIEISKELFETVKDMYKGAKINFILGDSSKSLKELCPSLITDTIFFLDGHWSCGDTGRGDKDCPLYEELETIVSLFKRSCIIIIDDVRLFGKGPKYGNEVCNWEDISIDTIKRIANCRTIDSYFIPSTLDPKDRYVIHLKSLSV